MNFVGFLFVNQQKKCGCLGGDTWGHKWGQEIKEKYSHPRIWNV